MKTLILKTLAIAMSAACAGALSAQSIAQPGQLAPAFEAALSTGWAPGPPSSSSNFAHQNTFLLMGQKHDRKVNGIWVGSMVAMLAASSFDAGSSWGKREGNSLLASSDGTFGAKGLSIKMGVAAAVIVPEVLLRHHKDLKSKFAIGDFAEAGLFTGVAIHNMGIPGPK